MARILLVGDFSSQAVLPKFEGCSVMTAPGLDSARQRIKQQRADLLIVSLGDQQAVPLGELEGFLRLDALRGCRAFLIAPSDSSATDLETSFPESGPVQVIREADSLPPRLREWLDCRRQIQQLTGQIEGMHQERQAREGLLQKLVHDMKSPLTVMLIELGMLERWWEKGKAERFQNGVFRLTQNCEELIEMIQNLLDMNRIQQGGLQIQLTTLGLASVLRDALDNLPSIVKKRGIQLELDLRDTERPLSIDPSVIHRVLLNLLKVSARLCPQGGRIVLSARQNRGRMEILLECWGLDMARQDCQALLDRYAHEKWRALGLDAGSGIGLNLGKLLVEAHQGRLSIQRPKGRGATFVVELPLASGSG